MINIAQIGCGYWGPNLLRNLVASKDCNTKYLVDLNAERREFVKRTYPSVEVVDSVDTVLQDASIDAVVIATPAETHFELAIKSLQNGKHIFVEKPLASSVEEVDKIAAEASSRNLTVMAGHTFIYNAAVRYVKKIINDGTIGELRYIYCQRLNLGRIRSDIDAWWNLAPHDVSIIQYWLDDLEPTKVTRTGMDFIQNGIDDVVFVNVTYPNKVIANIHVSWLDPTKIRRMVVVGSEKMVIYDDVAENKITIYDKGIDIRAVLGENMDFDKPPSSEVTYRSGDIFIPKIDFVEPLKTELAHFMECVSTGAVPQTGIEHARNVVRILSKAER